MDDLDKEHQEELKKECPQCGQIAELSSAYCSSCGKKLDEKEE